MDNMTALVCTFAKAYCYKNSHDLVFADHLASKMLSDEEYSKISQSMTKGISYFAPGFAGTPEEALRLVVEHQLAPSVLARSAFCERAINNAVTLGHKQIVVFACGYDTFSLRTQNRDLVVFELDRPKTIEDKQGRVARSGLEPACHVERLGCDLSQPSWTQTLLGAGFCPNRQAFGSLLGISYYLSPSELQGLVGAISSIWCEGSSICLDYPMLEGGMENRKNQELAAAAGEQMKATYSYEELEALLADAGFLIYEHLDARQATATFFEEYNSKNTKHGIKAPDGVGYCLAVKHHAKDD